MIGDVPGAEDVAQEAFVRVWRNAETYDPRRGSVATWVLTITRNLAIDAMRLRRAQPTDPDTMLVLAGAAVERSPEDLAAIRSEVESVRRALAGLSHDQRRALVLAAFYGRTAREISQSEGIPLGTAKTRIRDGLTKLRAALLEGKVAT